MKIKRELHNNFIYEFSENEKLAFIHNYFFKAELKWRFIFTSINACYKQKLGFRELCKARLFDYDFPF